MAEPVKIVSGRGLTKAKSRQRRKNANYYKAQTYATDANKKRKLGAYIRKWPRDLQAQKAYAKLYGDAALTGVLSAIKEAA